jgi:hypothetical protein
VRRFWNRKRAQITQRYLEDLVCEMDSRIRMGDPDFDDVIYRQRDAAQTLLNIRKGHDS